MIITKYKLLIAAVPFPFQGIASATTLKAAIRKVAYQARLSGIKHVSTKLVEEPEIMSITRIGG